MLGWERKNRKQPVNAYEPQVFNLEYLGFDIQIPGVWSVILYQFFLTRKIA